MKAKQPTKLQFNESDNLQVVSEMDYLGSEQPYGIRSNSGYLLFFPRITKYEDQDERYNKEVSEAFELSEIIIKALKAN